MALLSIRSSGCWSFAHRRSKVTTKVDLSLSSHKIYGLHVLGAFMSFWVSWGSFAVYEIGTGGWCSGTQAVSTCDRRFRRSVQPAAQRMLWETPRSFIARTTIRLN